MKYYIMSFLFSPFIYIFPCGYEILTHLIFSLPFCTFSHQITKNRFDGELGVMLLKFDKDTLSFVVRDKPAKRGDMHKEDGHSEEGFLPALLDEEANVLDCP